MPVGASEVLVFGMSNLELVVGKSVPPASRDNRAKPTDGGVARYTEYTFLRNAAPMIQLGAPSGGVEPSTVSDSYMPA